MAMNVLVQWSIRLICEWGEKNGDATGLSCNKTNSSCFFFSTPRQITERSLNASEEKNHQSDGLMQTPNAGGANNIAFLSICSYAFIYIYVDIPQAF